MTASHGKIFGLVPYDFRAPSLRRARGTFWNPKERRFLVLTFFGVDSTVNLRNAYRHPFQVFLFVGLIWLGLRSGRSG